MPLFGSSRRARAADDARVEAARPASRLGSVFHTTYPFCGTSATMILAQPMIALCLCVCVGVCMVYVCM